MSETALMIVDSALNLETIVAQRKLITDTMKAAMTEHVHYGKIQGCGDKPTLLQPGAQQLAFIFRLRPEYDIVTKDMASGHKEVEIVCRLIHTPTGTEVGRGVGLCSSMESKYRYRSAVMEVEETGDIVPPVYWDLKHKDPAEAKNWLTKTYGDGAGVKKISDVWQVVKYKGGSGEKIEHPNIADTLNTVLKICKKRAFVDAVITATAASDLFTQDLEDIEENNKTAEAFMKSKEAGESKPAQSQDKKFPDKKEKRVDAEVVNNKSGSWRDVTVHFGKTGGPILGKRLGDLKPSSLKYLKESIEAKEPEKRSDKDNALVEAIDQAFSNQDPGEKDEVPMGTPQENLAALLKTNAMSEVKFIEVANREGWTNAFLVMKMTGDEAQEIVGSWARCVEMFGKEFK